MDNIILDMLIFQKSNRKNKKYMVTLPNGKIIHFGDKKYQQFEDKTPLQLYSHLNHYDEKRRRLYYLRHPIDFPFPSADYFSKKYLW